MTESRLERWGVASLLLVCLFVGVPVLVSQLSGNDPTVVPAWLWWACYAAHLVVLGAVLVGFGVPSLPQRYLLVVLVLLGAAVVLLAPRAGWTAILLVFTTAVAAHVVDRRTVLLVLVLNSGLVALAAGLAGSGVVGMLLTAMIYAMLQACSAYAVWSEQNVTAARERLAVANTELRAATALLAESSRATERLRIARELHDVVGHQLTALVLELEVAAHRSTPPASEHVARARGLARDLLGDVRTAVGELRARPPRLREALAEMVADLPRPRVHLTIDERVRPDEEGAGALVRCVQEIVTNTIRHSDAANLWVRIGLGESGEVRLDARDDGAGAPLLRLGNGLTGVRERIEQLGGAVSFDTRSGFGVRAEVPAP